MLEDRIGKRAPTLALAALAGSLLLAGCFHLERMQLFTVSIVNDTGRPVVVRDCAHFCSSSFLTFDLAAGESTDVRRTTNDHKYFSVMTPAGAHIGCLDLFFREPRPGADVDVSQARACPAGSRPWKTIGLLLLLLVAVAGIGAALLMRPSRAAG